ncbi:hypothetical protein [Citrobacter braakii]
MYQKIYLNDWLMGLKSSCCTLIVTLLVFSRPVRVAIALAYLC